MKRIVLLATTALVLGACAQTHSRAPTASARPASASAASIMAPSAEVRDAQQRLQTLGLYHGAIDGMWGPDTQIAVERFQRNRSLAHTAVLDSTTAAALKAETPPARSAALARPIKMTAATDVRTIQNRLRQLNFYNGPADGVWGPRTQVALERFQKSHGLPVGQVTGQTVSAMGLDSNAFPTRTASASLTAHPLQPGVVRSVQRRLHQHGLYSGRADGIWGPRTRQAIERFQKSRGLDASGDLNPITASALGLDPNNLSSGAR